MLKRYLPILTWLPHYNRRLCGADLLAGIIVTIMVIPQSLAYAILAGLPAVVGLYASILPLLAYTLLGTSSTLAVGPVAIIALMTGAALAGVATPGSPEYLQAALVLSLLSGGMLTLMGLMRMGFFTNFLSHPVIAGFLSASGILIAASQAAHLLGIEANGYTVAELGLSLAGNLAGTHWSTLAIGAGSLVFLVAVRHAGKTTLQRLGLSESIAALLAKAGPVLAVVATTLLTWQLDLASKGVAVVGDIPRGLPPLTLPGFDAPLWRTLLVPALLISVVGFVESVSMGQMLAAKRRQRISPNQELIGLGGANLAAAFTAGMPVTGGLSRTVINFEAGAQTPMAGFFAALGIGLVTLALTPLLHHLPIATLAATITVAILTLVDIPMIRRTWRYSKSDFSAMAATILLTLVEGVEVGIVAGVLLSIGLFLYRTSRPHSALVGRIPGTEHFRNIERHRDGQPCRAAAHRREPLLRQRPLPRGYRLCPGGEPPGTRARGADLLRRQPHRRLGTGEPGRHQRPPQGLRRHPAPGRDQGTGDGPAEEQRLPRRHHRAGLPQHLCRLERAQAQLNHLPKQAVTLASPCLLPPGNLAPSPARH